MAFYTRNHFIMN